MCSTNDHGRFQQICGEQACLTMLQKSGDTQGSMFESLT
jgi:hypothetical protein